MPCPCMLQASWLEDLEPEGAEPGLPPPATKPKEPNLGSQTDPEAPADLWMQRKGRLLLFNQSEHGGGLLHTTA